MGYSNNNFEDYYKSLQIICLFSFLYSHQWLQNAVLSPRLPLLISRFSAVQKHTVEFNQLAMANSEGSEAMLNRVMTKDNIGVAVLLEVRKEMMEVSCE